jgi:hypothetical protein
VPSRVGLYRIGTCVSSFEGRTPKKASGSTWSSQADPATDSVSETAAAVSEGGGRGGPNILAGGRTVDCPFVPRLVPLVSVSIFPGAKLVNKG